MEKFELERRKEGFPGERLVVIPPNIAIKASREPILKDLCVTHVGQFVAPREHYVSRPRGVSQYILIACVSGSGSCEMRGKKWELKPGDILLIPPREAHVYQASQKAPWTIFWFHFRGERAQDYVQCLGVTPENPVVQVSDFSVIFEAFENAFQHTNHGFSETSLIGLTTGFIRLLGLARVHQLAYGEVAMLAERRLVKALSHMRENPETLWTVDQLAAVATLSVPHFTHLCRRHTGLPPLALMIRLRLQRAMNLLQRGTHNVAEAAMAVGYQDPFYFSRLFKKHMGMSPSMCRRGP